MQESINTKGSNLRITVFHAQILSRLIWAIKGYSSHLILLSSSNSGSSLFAKMTSWLSGIGVQYLSTMGYDSILEEVVKILKTGGKVDECLCIVNNEICETRP